MRLVAGIETVVVAIAAVGVLHDELADADQPTPAARLVAELRLEVVDDHGQLAIRLDDVLEEQRDDLLVSHRQDHVPFAAVLEADHLRADLEVATAVLPDLGRMDHRHLHLLAADPVDLLADHLLDAVGRPFAQGQQRVDARSELTDIAGAQQQSMRRHLRFGWVVAQGGEEEGRKSHGRTRIAALTSGDQSLIRDGRCQDTAQYACSPSPPRRQPVPGVRHATWKP